ncbi:MAG: methylmalonyl-CoA mutase family protein [Deltaproteobacteria bacterium]|nr:methylmalonyl-CoA mutase family protein [Deltaproteobacteria bacterium]
MGNLPERQKGDSPKEFSTLSSRLIRRLYTPEDTADLDPDKDIGKAGEYPFTRGIHQSMYRGRLWTMRQFAGFGTAEDTNKRFKYLLSHGMMGLSTAFDMPTLMGYDPDHPIAGGEVGIEGVAISSLSDMELLFDGIPLDKITTSMTINAPAIVLMAMYVAVGEKQGLRPDQLGGTIQADILKEFIAQKEWICPPEASVRILMDMVDWCSKEMPKWNSISISGYHIREAGATAVQELAFTLGDGVAYVEEGIRRGMDVDKFAPRLSFFFDVHNDFFEEIAKFRAARRLWARLMKERFKAKNPRSWMLRTHAQTAGVSLTAQQPYNNVVRTTIQALAAVLGGTQSLHTNSLDETYALPTEEAVRIALRTQQIIAHESGVVGTVDPFGGSYFVESLTDEMEKEAQAIIRKIDEMGGMLRAIDLGYPQREIIESAFRYQRQVETKEKIIVGVNDFVSEKEPPIETLKISREAEKRQLKRLSEVKKKRNARKVEESLTQLKKAAASRENLMPSVLKAVKEYATLGEVVSVFKSVFGTYKDPGHY